MNKIPPADFKGLSRMSEILILSEKIKRQFLRMTAPVCHFLSNLGVSPNAISFAGLILSMVAGGFYGGGFFFQGGLVLIVAGICDVLDGQMARQSGRHSLFGAFIDSAIDRFSENFIFIGFAWYFSERVSPGHGNYLERAQWTSHFNFIFIDSGSAKFIGKKSSLLTLLGKLVPDI